MLTYSTCADCQQPLIVTEPHQTVHDGCTPRHRTVEYLAEEWLTAALAGDETEATRLEELITMIDDKPPRLAEAAVLYASWGWPVFPLKPSCGPDGCPKCKGGTPCGKRPATKHGFKDASTDPDRLHGWWSRHPTCNIGLATGHRFDVIDIDGLGGNQHTVAGAWAYAQMLAKEGTLMPSGKPYRMPDCHGQVATASGGMHLYIKPTGDGNRAGLAAGIDYRGLGGYVVAPPSTLGTRGRSWSWIYKPSPTLKVVGAHG
jgi:hypothetical protein